MCARSTLNPTGGSGFLSHEQLKLQNDEPFGADHGVDGGSHLHDFTVLTSPESKSKVEADLAKFTDWNFTTSRATLLNDDARHDNDCLQNGEEAVDEMFSLQEQLSSEISYDMSLAWLAGVPPEFVLRTPVTSSSEEDDADGGKESEPGDDEGGKKEDDGKKMEKMKKRKKKKKKKKKKKTKNQRPVRQDPVEAQYSVTDNYHEKRSTSDRIWEWIPFSRARKTRLAKQSAAKKLTNVKGRHAVFSRQRALARIRVGIDDIKIVLGELGNKTMEAEQRTNIRAKRLYYTKIDMDLRQQIRFQTNDDLSRVDTHSDIYLNTVDTLNTNNPPSGPDSQLSVASDLPRQKGGGGQTPWMDPRSAFINQLNRDVTALQENFRALVEKSKVDKDNSTDAPDDTVRRQGVDIRLHQENIIVSAHSLQRLVQQSEKDGSWGKMQEYVVEREAAIRDLSSRLVMAQKEAREVREIAIQNESIMQRRIVALQHEIALLRKPPNAEGVDERGGKTHGLSDNTPSASQTDSSNIDHILPAARDKDDSVELISELRKAIESLELRNFELRGALAAAKSLATKTVGTK
eukprot:g5037.t1